MISHLPLVEIMSEPKSSLKVSLTHSVWDGNTIKVSFPFFGPSGYLSPNLGVRSDVAVSHNGNPCFTSKILSVPPFLFGFNPTRNENILEWNSHWLPQYGGQ